MERGNVFVGFNEENVVLFAADRPLQVKRLDALCLHLEVLNVVEIHRSAGLPAEIGHQEQHETSCYYKGSEVLEIHM